MKKPHPFDVAAKAGLFTLNQSRVILLLSAGPLAMNELSRPLGVTTGAMTGIADKLEHLGLATREQLHGNRRVNYLTLTKKGARLAKELAVIPAKQFTAPAAQ